MRHAKMARTNLLGEDKIAPSATGINVVQGSQGKACTHEVSWPEGLEGSPLPPQPKAGRPAKEYAFSLDPFQQTAINCLEAGHSVLVAAHTSAGKTVVAEYAFAMALRDNQRVIYTSPLKALSNQKYREFYEEFQDVGLMTGDVTINPNASCLVMTTEILRSMLYKGSEIVREAQLLVFDEIHYLRDTERGVVWEESIVLAPKTARFAFLSATIPNAQEFTQWIAKTHRSPCHVVYTDYRPTPLQHYLFPAGADGLYLVVDEQGAFREDNFQKTVAALTDTAGDANGKKGGKKSKGSTTVQGDKEKSDIFKLVRLAMQRNYDPLIVFSFSKKECELLARQMTELDLNNTSEKKLVEGIFWNAVDILSEEDRRLPQVAAILPMLKRGIGIHHSGLLPILKEVIEIMFQEGLLKCLFATETFSTGLNMPAKTVVFTNARKFDGGSFRWLSSGEYIQMSGRAGRRGLDDKGVVVMMLDTKMEPPVARDMVKGAPDQLRSAFHLNYSSLLNMLRCEGVEPEALMKASFAQFQMERSLPQLQARVTQIESKADEVQIEEEEKVKAYQQLLQQATETAADMRAVVNTPQHLLPFLQPGRLVQVLQPDTGNTSNKHKGAPAPALPTPETAIWGAIVNFERVGSEDAEDADPTDGGDGGASRKRKPRTYIVDVLANCAADTLPGMGPRRRPQLVPASGQGVPQVVPCQLSELAALSSVRIYISKDLRPLESRQLGLKAVSEVARRFSKGLPLLDAEVDMKVDDSAYRKAQRRAEALEGMLERHPLHKHPELPGRLQQLAEKQGLLEAAKIARKEAKAAHSMILKDELKARRRVLRRLGYVSMEGVVEVKGRVAAEIQSADELVLTELIFSGAFKDLTCEQVVALVSACVWRERGEQRPRVREDMQGPYRSLLEAARRIGKVAQECKLTLDVEDYVNSFRADLMNATAAWCRGARFAEVLKMSDVFEGSLVRAVRRIEEVLRQLSAGVHAVGDMELEQLFEQTRERIKRDIIFAASLYL